MTIQRMPLIILHLHLHHWHGYITKISNPLESSENPNLPSTSQAAPSQNQDEDEGSINLEMEMEPDSILDYLSTMDIEAYARKLAEGLLSLEFISIHSPHFSLARSWCFKVVRGEGPEIEFLRFSGSDEERFDEISGSLFV